MSSLALSALLAPLSRRSWSSAGIRAASTFDFQRIVTPLSNLVPFALLDVAARRGHRRLAGRTSTRVIRVRRPLAGAADASSCTLAVFTGGALSGLPAAVGPELPPRAARRKAGVRRSRGHPRSALSDWPPRPCGLRQRRATSRRMRQHADGPALPRRLPTRSALLGAADSRNPACRSDRCSVSYFRWAAIDGMTDPFFLEVIVNPDVLPVERPFVLAHEWAHLAGYADESEANFVAWLTCVQRRRAGPLQRLARAVRASEQRAAARGSPCAGRGSRPGPRQDLIAINARLRGRRRSCGARPATSTTRT